MTRRFLFVSLAVLGLVAAACGDEVAVGPTSSGPTTTSSPSTSTSSPSSTSTTSSPSSTSTTSTPATTSTAPPTSPPPTSPPPTSPPPTSPPPTSPPPTSPPPTTAPANPAVVVTKGTSGRHEIALTFDAGADVGAAADILDLLAAEGIHASFGMTGAWADDNPALVARIAAEGHLLMNHTDSHPDMTTISTAQRLAELAAADEAVSAIIGRTMQPYFRPPFGASDASVLRDIARDGYRYSVMWTVDSLGWKGLDPGAVAERCLDGAVDGAIILMHVGSQSTDVDALPEVIAGLRADGYAFVTVAQLLR